MSLVLCGPIVRRTTSKAVYIWMATDSDASLSGAIRVRGANDVISIDGGSKKVQLGQNLYVHLVCMRPQSGKPPFPEDTILHYDIFSILPDGKQQSLLEGDPDIRYPGEPYPGFVIPKQLDRLLHGSCRKPHAGAVKKAWGNIDQLSVGDDLLAKSFQNPGERASTLLMTGDQIYADDVSGPMLDHLIRLGHEITGWDEMMPRRRPPAWHGYKTGDDHKRAADMRLYGRRAELSKEFTGITSGKSRNHLMTFGEYAAMYLTVWGGPGAKTNLADWDAVKDRMSSSVSSRTYKKERELTEAFCKTLSKVRRLLANISVYMIFDDHDVSDDWNITPSWEQQVQESPRARRVVSNALAAYWAFQGWGNNPAQFDQRFINTLSEHLLNQSYADDKAHAFDALLWQKKVDRWAYVAPTSPAIVVLDTRTCRLPGKRASSPVGLMNQPALNWLKTELEQVLTAAGEHVCLVSATPVFGLQVVENLQRIAYVISGNAAAVDLESWNEGFDALQATITSIANAPASISILSGDVHYSFMRKGKFKIDSDNHIRVFQMTSSPLHNQAPNLQFSHRDVLIQHGEFVASQESYQGNSDVVISINNLAMVRFDADGKALEQQLIATLSRGKKKYVTYHV